MLILSIKKQSCGGHASDALYLEFILSPMGREPNVWIRILEDHTVLAGPLGFI
jgi:hypothetical protein